MVEHRSVVNYTQDVRVQYDLAGPRSYGMLQPLTVDSSVTMLCPALLSGGCLHLISDQRALDAAALADYFSSHRIDCLKIAPSHLATLQTSSRADAILPQSLLVIGGETSRRDWAQSLVTIAPSCRMFNHYGPTETTAGVLTFPLTQESLKDCPARLLLGRPLANCVAYILDRHENPIPIGIVGELYVGGDCLARGYWNRPELTAAKFVPSPFCHHSAKLLYKTGDMVHYRPDGNIEFLGRADHQVKIRGFRIELGEVERALAAHPGIREVVALVRGDGSQDQRIVAYFVSHAEPVPTQGELREFLKQKLPAYMMPAAFVPLRGLPRTAHGKLDLNAFPNDDCRPDLETRFAAPRNELERRLPGIWKQVLTVKEIGIHDNFFELGGHSLLATQTMSRITGDFHINLPLSALFESPTIAGLAIVLAQKQQGSGNAAVNSIRKDRLRNPDLGSFFAELTDAASHLPDLKETRADEITKKVEGLSPAKRTLLDLRMKKKEVEGGIPHREGREKAALSFAQQRLWFLQQLETESPAYNVYGAVKLKGRLNEEALRGSLKEIVRRHETLRTRFVEVEGRAMQVVGDGAEVELPIIELSGVQERERETLRLAIEEASIPFDLGRGPLLRGKLLRLGEEEHVLLLIVHHIVSDGWSVGVLVRELGVLYEAYAAGKESPLPELPIQYADYAEWQREYVQGEVVEEQLEYWRKQLGGELPVVELPGDHVRPAVRSYRGAQQELRVSREVTEKLKQMSQKEGATLFMTLLAAFDVLLARYSGQEELVVGTPIANRTRVETEELIGCFVNTLVLRVDASGNPGFCELLRRVKQVALEAYAHQDIPFEKLVEELQPKRDLSRTALFQVMFVLQNVPMAEMKLGGLTLSGVEFDHQVAKFDLTVTMWEAEEGLTGVVEYSTDLFEAGTMERLVGHWERLVEGSAKNAEQRVGELPR